MYSDRFSAERKPRAGQWQIVYETRQRAAAEALPWLRELDASFSIEPGTLAVATIRDTIELCEFWANGKQPAAHGERQPVVSRRGSGLDHRRGQWGWRGVQLARQGLAGQVLPFLQALEVSLSIEPGTGALATVRDCIDLCVFWLDEKATEKHE